MDEKCVLYSQQFRQVRYFVGNTTPKLFAAWKSTVCPRSDLSVNAEHDRLSLSIPGIYGERINTASQ